MRHILLDTNVLSDFFFGDPETVEAFQRASSLALNTTVLGELLAGFAMGDRSGENRRLLSRLLANPRVNLLPLVPDTAEHYASVFSQLRRKGRPIPSNDMWVAASALEHGLLLLTRDSHFAEIDGLLTASTVDQLLP
ncbi:MAG: type II toxin-antitoxin system VapC family toxin [Thermoleophilia bacterium]|nr:type II toxin-antitoxin system VapC family toxin [Thermoleophilia bacterium]